jgi:hypothetical protein
MCESLHEQQLFDHRVATANTRPVPSIVCSFLDEKLY